MNKIKAFFSGWKSYSLAALAIAYAGSIAFLGIPSLEWVWGVLGGSVVLALREAISKIEAGLPK